MQLLFDGHFWLSGPPSGQMVLRNMVGTWAAEFPGDRVTVALPRRPMPDEAALIDSCGAGWTVRRISLHPVSNFIELPRLARTLGADWVIAQNFTPATGRSATFVHDVLFQTNPEWFTRIERIYLWPIPLMARRAGVIFTSSRSELARIHRSNPSLRRRRFATTGLAPSVSLTNAVPSPPDNLRLPEGEFLLSVGRLNVRKNVETTVMAALAAGVVDPTRPFVLVGEPDGRAALRNGTFREAVASGTVVFTGRVSWGQLAWLYAHARALLFTSLDEGYGLPPLEASAFGCPVVVSDIPVMREVMGDKAFFVDPRDTSAIADRLRRLPSRVAESAVLRHNMPGWPDVVGIMREELLAVGDESSRMGATDA